MTTQEAADIELREWQDAKAERERIDAMWARLSSLTRRLEALREKQK